MGSSLKGKNVVILNENLEVLREIPASKLNFTQVDGAYVVMTDAASKSVVEGANMVGAKYVAAKSFDKVDDSAGTEFVSI